MSTNTLSWGRLGIMKCRNRSCVFPAMGGSEWCRMHGYMGEPIGEEIDEVRTVVEEAFAKFSGTLYEQWAMADAQEFRG